MEKFCWWGGTVSITTVVAIIIAKAQSNPKIWYAWLLKEPHVVPTLIVVTVCFWLTALGQHERIKRFYWRVFSFFFKPLVPPPPVPQEKGSSELVEAGGIPSEEKFGIGGSAGIPSTFRTGQGGMVANQPIEEALAQRNAKIQNIYGHPNDPPLLAIKATRYDPDHHDSDTRFRNIVRGVIQNQSGRDIEVWSPLWEATSGVHDVSPCWSMLCAESINGWVIDWDKKIWEADSECLVVTAGRSFQFKIGLTEPHGEGIQMRLQSKTTGTLIVPLKLFGKLRVQPLEL